MTLLKVIVIVYVIGFAIANCSDKTRRKVGCGFCFSNRQQHQQQRKQNRHIYNHHLYQQQCQHRNVPSVVLGDSLLSSLSFSSFQQPQNHKQQREKLRFFATNRGNEVSNGSIRRTYTCSASRLALSAMATGAAASSTTPSIVSPLYKEEDQQQDMVLDRDIVICGGGPAGLLTAIMLAQKFSKEGKNNDDNLDNNGNNNQRTITIIDRLTQTPASPDDDTFWNNDVSKFYLIGLGGRGQSALDHFGLWDPIVQSRCVPVLGRKDWSPPLSSSKEEEDAEVEGIERIFDPKVKRVTTQILPRDKLVSILYEYIQTNYNCNNNPTTESNQNENNGMDHTLYHKNDSCRIEYYNGYQVQPNINFHYKDSTKCLLQIVKCVTNDDDNLNMKDTCEVATDHDNSVLYISANLVLAADGTVRTFANAIENDQQQHQPMTKWLWLRQSQQPFKVKRYIDDNKRLYKTIPMKLPPSWRYDLNYSARTNAPKSSSSSSSSSASKESKTSYYGDINFDALPANTVGDYCGILLIRPNDPLASVSSNVSEVRRRLNDVLPQFSKLIDDDTLLKVALKPASPLPSFRYVGPQLHYGNSCLLLGDCIHTVKPYFGLGANSALEDVKVLSDVIDSIPGGIDSAETTTKVLTEYTKRRAMDSKTLVRLSRELDRPGKLGLITFIIPIILDGIFTKIAPKLFHPNTITMLQNENLTFQQVARIKRQDRFLQSMILFSIVLGIVSGTKYVFHTLISATIIFCQKNPLRICITSSLSPATIVGTGLLMLLLLLVRTLSKSKIGSLPSMKQNRHDDNNKLNEGNEATEKIIQRSEQRFLKPVFGFRKRR